MKTVKAPCLNSFCKETAEFKKGSVKWVMSCPSCGSQFYQKKEAKAQVEKYLEKYQSDESSADDVNETNSTDANENNGGEQETKPKDKPEKRRLLGRFSKRVSHG